MKCTPFLACFGLHFRPLDVLKAQFCWCTLISGGCDSSHMALIHYYYSPGFCLASPANTSAWKKKNLMLKKIRSEGIYISILTLLLLFWLISARQKADHNIAHEVPSRLLLCLIEDCQIQVIYLELCTRVSPNNSLT